MTHNLKVWPEFFNLLGSDEKNFEILPLHRLKIVSPQLIVLRIVGQSVGTTGIIGRAQFDEHLQRRTLPLGFGLGDVNRIWIVVCGVHRTAAGGIVDRQYIAAVWPLPAPFELGEVRVARA